MTSLVAAAGTLLPLLAQAAAPVGGTSTVAGAYRVGPGDVLEVSVEGRPDLSRLPTVQTTGSVWLPRAGEVAVVGLTPDEIASRLAPRLAGEDLPAPRVAVRVKDYQSQFVWVRGEVQRPGRKPLRSGTRLVDALLDAGGFTARASGEVTIERPTGIFPDGSHTLRVRLSGRAPSPQELEELAQPLAGGDVLTAAAQRWLTVSGEVKRPGRYPLDGPLTLTRAIEAAGGLTRYASDRLSIRRRDAQGGGTHDIEVDLKAIRDGKAEDPVLAPDDQVSVGGRRL
jgi:polysaccharide export outer membrane protein